MIESGEIKRRRERNKRPADNTRYGWLVIVLELVIHKCGDQLGLPAAAVAEEHAFKYLIHLSLENFLHKKI